MPQINNFPGGFAAGLTIRGMPIAVTHPGKVFWVGNSGVLSDRQIGSSDGNKGNYDSPMSTITGALASVVANRGDIIMVKPGHAETVATAAGIVLNKAGVAIIGLGTGSSRPTITMSVATSTISVVASNMSIQNFIFKGTAATTFVAAVFAETNATVANDFMIDNCEFRDGSATTGIVACYTGGTTANQSDGMTFTNNKVFRSLTSPPAANTAVVLGAATNRVDFSHNFIVNLTANNNIPVGLELGANAALNIKISNNLTTTQNTGTTAGELFGGGSTTSRGLVFGNYSHHLAATGLLGPVLTKMGWVENYCSVTGAVDSSAKINPVAA